MWLKTSLLMPVVLGPLVSLEAYCEVYMSDQKAADVIFPGLKFEKKLIPLSADEQKTIEKRSGERVRGNAVNLWRASTGECVFIDQVLGKHEFITYAIGIDKKGKVKGIEILEYRESFGQDVRGKWREQFIGKDKTAPLKLDDDIKNLSGATLSSSHISGGVRRLLHTYEVIKSHG